LGFLPVPGIGAKVSERRNVRWIGACYGVIGELEAAGVGSMLVGKDCDARDLPCNRCVYRTLLGCGQLRRGGRLGQRDLCAVLLPTTSLSRGGCRGTSIVILVVTAFSCAFVGWAMMRLDL
jgi:hypothetical protein